MSLIKLDFEIYVSFDGSILMGILLQKCLWVGVKAVDIDEGFSLEWIFIV